MTPDAAGIEAALAAGLAAHDDPPGWMWSVSDQMVYSCECGDHYVAGAIDVIQEHDVVAAAAWHRAHVAAALLPVVTQAQADVWWKAAGEVADWEFPLPDDASKDAIATRVVLLERLARLVTRLRARADESGA